MPRSVHFSDSEPEVIAGPSNHNRVYLEEEDVVIVRDNDYCAPSMSHANIIRMHQEGSTSGPRGFRLGRVVGGEQIICFALGP